jgi:FAD/FMN-containing dehydrogenase
MNRRRFFRNSLSAAVVAALPAHSALAALNGMLLEVSSDIDALTGDRNEVTLRKSAVQDFGDSLRGNLLLPGNAAYDKARHVLNPGIDKHPALVAQCAGASDVRNAINFARAENLLVAVKCGGHSASGKSTCNGGLQIDLSLMRHARVDPVNKTAQIAGGSLLRELDQEAMAFGLVTTAGTVSHTGVGGLTLGGGFGRLGRRFGLTLDNVISMDVVTADGEYRRASADENPDLYWGLRGGGGNFGVVTSFEFQLHPMQREVISANFTFPVSEAKSVLNFFGEYCEEAEDNLQVDGGIFAGTKRDIGVGIFVCFSGPHDKAEKLFAPIRKAGTVVNERVGAMDYVHLQQVGDDEDPRNGRYLKSGFIGIMTPALVDDIITVFEPNPGRTNSVIFQQSGGAIGRVAPDATAFAHRDSKHNMLCNVSWPQGSDPTEHIKYIREVWSGVEKHVQGFYTNDLYEESQSMVNSNYRDNYGRLVALKDRYDPTNLLRLNANVQPTG